ncbi:CRISPR-associated protein, Csy4 family [uncultured Candidatus Thioglobus sp.]|nr:CRISPR-associated protein, Csy4 family [uncultured Candidatus Thioglobus sp.]SMN02224.1 CRISPR-associated protein, Csy4 family [uncultured Candidatus Thioglobus sp.]
MNYYVDIKIQPDDEMRENVLLNKIYTKLHKTIYDLKATDIGISFPRANKKLGCIIRIHSTKNKLEALQAKNWLCGLSGYCKISDILLVPDKVDGYQTISRIRQNMSISRLQKKIAHQKSKGYLKTDDDIRSYEKHYKAKMLKTGLDNPYLELQSISTGSKYRLYITFGELQKTPVEGEFNRFGLSTTATVAIFSSSREN